MTYLFDPHPVPVVPMTDGKDFPVRRIYCIGKNYADHIREMGGTFGDTPAVFFTKPADGVICPTAENPDVPYPPATEKVHYEGEIVLALKSGGRDISPEDAMQHVCGIGLGSDQTRRDLQVACKKEGGPWDIAKGFDASAVVGPLTPGRELSDEFRYSLSVNGEKRQETVVGKMIVPPGEIIARLSRLFELKAGDLIFTGTPEGVGEVKIGDTVEIEGDGVAPLTFTMV